MDSKAFIQTNSLKDLLSLFDENSELQDLTLGDTWHPAAGFVDEKVLNGMRKISEILDLAYDFKGLVQFEAGIGTMKLKLINDMKNESDKEEYEIQGTEKDLEILRNKVIEANAYHPGTYELKLA